MAEYSFLTFDEDGRLQSDLRCIGCGYNLRTLTRESDCPECGKTVRETLKYKDGWITDYSWMKFAGTALLWLAAAYCLLVSATIVKLNVGHYRRTFNIHDLNIALFYLIPAGAFSVAVWATTIQPAVLMNWPKYQKHIASLLRTFAVIRPAGWWLMGAVVMTYSDRTSPRILVDLRSHLPSHWYLTTSLLIFELISALILWVYLKPICKKLVIKHAWFWYLISGGLLIAALNVFLFGAGLDHRVDDWFDAMHIPYPSGLWRWRERIMRYWMLAFSLLYLVCLVWMSIKLRRAAKQCVD